MSSLMQIQQYLSSRGLGFLMLIRLNEVSNTLLIEVPSDRLKSKAASGFTSRRQLSFVARSLSKKFDVRVVTAIRDAGRLTDVAAGLRAVLSRAFAGVVSDVFASFPVADHAVVWVETRQVLEGAVATEIDKATRAFLKETGIHCDEVEMVGPMLPEPSTIAILRSVKVLAPVTIDGIADDLGRRGFSCPSRSWLAAKLDAARKRRLILRDNRGRYLLTGMGLEVVPRTRSASSSDIDRMLMLARRKEW